jgi:hypothetical protein
MTDGSCTDTLRPAASALIPPIPDIPILSAIRTALILCFFISIPPNVNIKGYESRALYEDIIPESMLFVNDNPDIFTEKSAKKDPEIHSGS